MFSYKISGAWTYALTHFLLFLIDKQDNNDMFGLYLGVLDSYLIFFLIFPSSMFSTTFSRFT